LRGANDKYKGTWAFHASSGCPEILHPNDRALQLSFPSSNLVANKSTPTLRVYGDRKAWRADKLLYANLFATDFSSCTRQECIYRQAGMQARATKNSTLHHARDSYNKLICENVCRRVFKKRVAKKNCRDAISSG
jgi:hypothetical protein